MAVIKSGKKYTDDIRNSDNKKLLIDNAHRALDNLYKDIHILFQTNIIRKYEVKILDGITEQIKSLNEQVRHFESEEQLNNYEINRKLLHSKADLISSGLTILNEKIGASYVDANLSRVRVERVLGEEDKSNLNTCALEIINKSELSPDVDIKPEKIVEFNEAIDSLTDEVETNPEKWLKDRL